MEREAIEDFFTMLASDGFYEDVKTYATALAKAYRLLDQVGLSQRRICFIGIRIGNAGLLHWEK